MKSLSSLTELLVANTWKENLNVWIFDRSTITIKDYFRPSLDKRFKYILEFSDDKSYILKTQHPVIGDLFLSVDVVAPSPTITLRSMINNANGYTLIAFHGFSDEERQLIDKKIGQLERTLQSKKTQLRNRIQLNKTAGEYQEIEARRCEHFIQKMFDKVVMLKTVVRSTSNLATDFDQYVRNLENDMQKLIDEINSV